jgi:hypothetical protein
MSYSDQFETQQAICCHPAALTNFAASSVEREALRGEQGIRKNLEELYREICLREK